VPIEVIDIDKNPDLATLHGIRGVPTLLMVNEQGYEIKRLSGVHMAKILEDWIND
jgi:thioredoxin-like negative regulator of GroEL